MSCGCGYFGGEIECDSKESGMVFGATAKRMHKSTVAAGQSREQEGRQDSRASGRSLLDRRERKMNLSVRKRETRLPAAASGRRSLSPLSPFRFYDRRRDPRSLPPSLALPCSPGPRSVRLYQMGIHPLSLPPSLPCVNRERTAGRTSRATRHPPPCIFMRGCVLEGTATT